MRTEQKEKLIGFLNVLFPGIKITLFGSRARGNFKDRSDYDLALDIGRKITRLELAQAQNAIEALNIPQTIDLADMHAIPKEMKEIILKEGVIWKDPSNNYLIKSNLKKIINHVRGE
jgi:predicted nucleotidyltransferase